MKKATSIFITLAIASSMAACGLMPETMNTSPEYDNSGSETGSRAPKSEQDSGAAPPIMAETLPAYAINSSPEQWEYKIWHYAGIDYETAEEELNALGMEGWELVSAASFSNGGPIQLFFKRKLS